MKRALITGITGQDGSYLAEFLTSKGYEVHGTVRRVAIEDQQQRLRRILHIPDVRLHAATMESFASIMQVVSSVMPDECYHLAAQSFVTSSFEDEYSTFNTNINGTHYVLSALRSMVPWCRFYFAASSEMFGDSQTQIQNEETPLRPRSAYGISKATGFLLTRNYREAHGIHASSGILFNHESPRRGTEFVTRKITRAVAAIKTGKQTQLTLGNLDARRDWGHAADYVKAMWLMLQELTPSDYVIATGETHSVREFCDCAFSKVGLDFRKHVAVDKLLFRPSDIGSLCGDATKAHRVLGWKPTHTFNQLVAEMVNHDVSGG